MPKPLTASTVAERLQDSARDEYLYAGSIMQGIALGMGTLALFSIVINDPLDFTRLSPWFVSFIALVVSHSKWSRGVLLTNAHKNVLDSICPMFMGVLEVLLFAVLTVDDAIPDRVILLWVLLLALHSALAACLVLNRIWVIKPEDFDETLRAFVMSKVRRWLWMDVCGATVTAVFAFAAWVVVLYVEARVGIVEAAQLQTGLAVLFGVVLGYVVYRTHIEFLEVDRHISAV